MGNLLRVLNDRGSVPKVDFFVDFETAEPTPEEGEVHRKVATVLDRAPDILADLHGYKGAGEHIREAISNSKSEKHQDVAWKAVCPSVILLKKFYEFALELETALCDLLTVLCSPDMPAIQHLEKQQAITKQFAEILHFTLSFDDLKMTSPAIQNDFSYYRRTLNRRRMEDTSAAVAELSDGVDLPDDVANRMSLFYANPTPMLNTLSGAAEKLLQENPSLTLDNMTNCFSAMASVCRVISDNPQYTSRFQSEETQLFCLRVMVGVIILYDHVHPVGAFAVKAAIDVRRDEGESI
ncbi:CYFIP-related Rac1 interactor B [Geodia barretti]|uniref:CYFIP-related Rac1 interactor B n=1 Tax=Geodia barretti TaxID=519541 RepID=A0AA35T9N0_GEOBA|nr:CYFIP-related Rac1 interactor B [Geodia barretti]